MDKSSPSRVAGTVVREVSLGGAVYTLSQPNRVRRAADEEAVVIGRRLDMLPAVVKSCAALPEGERDAWRRNYLSTMVCGIASPDEWSNFFRSLWHLAFRLWCALDPKHKEGMTLLEGVGWAYELVNNDSITKDEMESLDTALRLVSQEGEIKN